MEPAGRLEVDLPDADPETWVPPWAAGFGFEAWARTDSLCEGTLRVTVAPRRVVAAVPSDIRRAVATEPVLPLPWLYPREPVPITVCGARTTSRGPPGAPGPGLYPPGAGPQP